MRHPANVKTCAFIMLLGAVAFGWTTSQGHGVKQKVVRTKPIAANQPSSYGKITFIRDVKYQRDGDWYWIIGDLYAMNSDGSKQTKLKSNVKVPYGVNPNRELSPDGKRRAFARGVDGNSQDIYIQNLDGSGEINLTGGKGIRGYNIQPSWSPDGNRIVFASGSYIEHTTSTSIYVIKIDGSEVKRLTEEMGDSDPVFSPYGRKIAFSRRRPGRSINIYVMNADGSQQKQLTRAFRRSDAFPTWSPDGRRIAFQAESYNPRQLFEAEIFVINSDGTKETRLTRNKTADMFPFWIRNKTSTK